MEKVTYSDLVDTVLVKSKFVVVDFYAEWCGPCKMLTPVLKELENEYQNVTFVKVDVDANMVVTEVWEIKSVPTIMVFENGVRTHFLAGYQSKINLKKVLDNLK